MNFYFIYFYTIITKLFGSYRLNANLTTLCKITCKKKSWKGCGRRAFHFIFRSGRSIQSIQKIIFLSRAII